MSAAIDHNALSGIRAMRSLVDLTTNKKLMVPTMCELFSALVKPILMYGGEFWVHTEQSALEHVLLKFYKYVLELPLSSPNAGVLGELGCFPLWVSTKYQVLKYWWRYTHSNIPNLLKEAFTLSKDVHLKEVNNWYTKTKKLMSSYNLLQVDSDLFLSMAKMSIEQSFVEIWKSDLSRLSAKRGSGGNMLRTYNIFKKCFAMESYLFGVPKPWRVALTRLRIGVHNLQVNLGRHHNPVIPLNNRICLYCFNQEGRRILEDEFHLVIVCPLYSNLRLDLFEKWCEFDPDFCCLPPLTQFSCLMSSSTPYCSYIFSIFVYKSLLLNNNT